MRPESIMATFDSDRIARQRSAVVLEAMEWCRTPFSHRQRAKGLGVDCGALIAEVYERTGEVERVELPEYTRDWFLHCKTEDSTLYANFLDRYLRRVPEWEPGDVASFSYGVCRVAHAGIIVDKVHIVAASAIDRMVTLNEWDRAPLKERLTGFWSSRRWHSSG